MDRQNLTWPDRAEALQKLTRYLREKVKETGSLSSISMFSAGLSTFVKLRRVTDPLPMSPLQENLMPSLDASIVTVNALIRNAVSGGDIGEEHTGLRHGQ